VESALSPQSTKFVPPEAGIQKATWKEFRRSGLLWWINRSLHLFGWAIAVEVELEWHESTETPRLGEWVRIEWDGGYLESKMVNLDELGWPSVVADNFPSVLDGIEWRWRYRDEEPDILQVYPVRCVYRGFTRETEEEGFAMLTAHMADQAPGLHTYMVDRAKRD
jgi:hypothetical protein